MDKDASLQSRENPQQNEGHIAPNFGYVGGVNEQNLVHPVDRKSTTRLPELA